MTDDSVGREYVRKLFGRDEPEPQPEPADPAKGNHVPREGAITGPGRLTGEAEAREWARELFGRAALELP